MSSKHFKGWNVEEMRIVMVGKTGNGKSATGNTILGRQCFVSKFSARSMTVDCSKGSGVVFGQRVAVIDTPGLFDTRFGMDKTTQDLSQCISYSSPGPHIFLVVILLGRYTEEEKQTVARVQEMFGQAADRYSMVLFTHGDQLEDKTIEEFVEESSDLQELVRRCNNQYHVFNNKSSDPSQVTQLLQKIRNVVQRNGGSHYTNQMFQEAERAIERENQRIRREEEMRIRQERERIEREQEEQMRVMRERLWVEREIQRQRMQEERQREIRRQNEEREMERRRAEREREEERRRNEEEQRQEMERMRRQYEEQQERQREEARQYEEARRRRIEREQNEGCTIL